MAQRSESSLPVFSLVCHIVAIPCNFFGGCIVGLAAAVAAMAAVVGGVRLLTGKVPFPSPVGDEQGEKRLSLRLVPPDQVGGLFAEQKQKVGDDLANLRTEIRAIVQETRAEMPTAHEEDEAPLVGA